MKRRILIVKDEIHLALELQEIFEKQEWTVDVTYDGENGIAYAQNNSYHLILLDTKLPVMNGLEVIKKIKKLKITVPIFMLIGNEVSDEMKSELIFQANDYLIKPYVLKELLAKVRELLQKNGNNVKDSVAYGNIEINLKNNSLICEENSITLTEKEYKIIAFFLYNPEQIVSKQRIIDKIWGIDSDADSNNIEVYISFLRKKMKMLGANVQIRTVRGAGYALTMCR